MCILRNGKNVNRIRIALVGPTTHKHEAGFMKSLKQNHSDCINSHANLLLVLVLLESPHGDLTAGTSYDETIDEGPVKQPADSLQSLQSLIQTTLARLMPKTC